MSIQTLAANTGGLATGWTPPVANGTADVLAAWQKHSTAANATDPTAQNGIGSAASGAANLGATADGQSMQGLSSQLQDALLQMQSGASINLPGSSGGLFGASSFTGGESGGIGGFTPSGLSLTQAMQAYGGRALGGLAGVAGTALSATPIGGAAIAGSSLAGAALSGGLG
jgi:hypothetical protein